MLPRIRRAENLSRNRKIKQVLLRKKIKRMIKSPVPKRIRRAGIRRNQTRAARPKRIRKADKRPGNIKRDILIMDCSRKEELLPEKEDLILKSAGL